MWRPNAIYGSEFANRCRKAIFMVATLKIQCRSDQRVHPSLVYLLVSGSCRWANCEVNMSKSKKGVLHAILREMEPGVFRAEYPGEMNQDEATVEAFPD